jgi:YD repeat-containing protein
MKKANLQHRAREFCCFSLLGFIAVTGIAHADNAAMPGVYDIPGYNPTREYGADSFDSIDPATGQLKLVHTDLVLPLNGEVDIKIQRSYHLHQRADDMSLWYYNDQEDGRGVVGANWDIHLGRIWPAGNVIAASNSMTCRDVLNDNSGANRNVLELSDGTKLTLYKTASSDTTNAFITPQRWVARCLPTASDATGKGGLIVYSPEGLKYTFNEQGYSKKSTSTVQPYVVTKIEDRNGNSVTVNYIRSDTTLQPYLLLSKIDPSESGAPDINFSYKDATGKVTAPFGLDVQLDKITAGDRTISYQYQEVMQPNGSSYGSSTVPKQYKLTDVTLADSTKWLYTYYPTSNSTLQSAPLNTVTSPLSGLYTYSYVLQTVGSLTTSNKQRLVTSSRALSGLGTWSYAYVFNGTFDANDTTTVTGPTDCIKYEHRVLSTAVWDSGTLRKKTTFEPNCSTSRQVENYTWEGEQISQDNQVSARPLITATGTRLPRLKEAKITRDSTDYTKTFSNFDAYGNPGTIVSQQAGKELKTVNYTYDPKPTKWVLRLVSGETYGTLGSITRIFGSSGNMDSETSFGKTTSFSYIGGELNTKTEPGVVQTTYSNYKAGVPKNISPPAGSAVSRDVDDFGNITQETHAALTPAPSGHAADTGVTVNYGYDKANRLTNITTPRLDDVNVGIVFSFTSAANTRTITRGSSKTTETYDKFGRKITTKTEDTSAGTYIASRSDFDAVGRITDEYYPTNIAAFTKSKHYDYDALARVTTLTNSADASTVTNTYQANNKVLVTDEDARQTTYSYRSFDNPDEKELIEIAAPEAQTTTINRNILGMITSVVQGGVTHSYSYNTKMLLESETRPELGTITYSRDDRGNMMSRYVTFGGTTSGTTNFGYDGLNRLKTIDYPSTTPDVAITYNKFGHPWQVTKGDSIWDYDYDANNNLTSEKLALSGAIARTLTLSHSYDVLDSEVTTTFPSGKVLTYTRDAFGRATSMSQTGGLGNLASSIDYYPSGNLKSYTYGNGLKMDVTETARRWPSRSSLSNASLVDFTYAYKSSGDVDSITDSARPSRTRSFTYDGLHRLYDVTGSGSWGNAAIRYNARGDITSKTAGSGTNYTFNYNTTTRRLDSISGSGNWTYGYDVYGNVTAKGGTTFTYDDASNMVRDSSSATNNYLYDGHSRRYWQKDGAGKETVSMYSLAGQLVYQEEVQDKTPRDYIYLSGQLLTRIDYCDTALDSDGDGIPDCTEKAQGLNPNVADANLDKDGDGLTNIQEYQLGTLANNPDTDHDGMPDGYEVANGFDPKSAADANADYDGDTITNYMEYVMGTNPRLVDSDNDGIPDNLDSAPMFNVAAFVPIMYLLLN